MRVTVRLFARLRDIAGAGELSRDAAPGADVASVWRALAAEFPELSAYERSISCAVTACVLPKLINSFRNPSGRASYF